VSIAKNITMLMIFAVESDAWRAPQAPSVMQSRFVS